MRNRAVALALGALVAASAALAADPATIDWSAVPARKVTLFYPGQASYEWLQSAEHKKGDRAIAQGRSCTTCHQDDEADLGNRLAKGTSNEATPIAGKKGTLDLNVQAAHDDKFLYLRFQWATQNKAPGDAYPQLRFDGKEWQRFGGPRLDKDVREGKMQAVYEDRLSVMVDDGKVANFARHGCWVSCHDGMRDMRNEATKDQKGTVIPVIISIYSDRSFEFILKSPPASELLKQAAGIAKGSPTPHTDKVGKVTKAQVRQIAERKAKDLNARSVDAAVKIVMGTARSMGVEVKD